MLPWFLAASCSADLHFSELPPDLVRDPGACAAAPARDASQRPDRAVQPGLAALGGKAIGSGVILQLSDGEALIVTNRHVVDDEFPASRSDAAQCRPSHPTGQDVGQLLGQPTS